MKISHPLSAGNQHRKKRDKIVDTSQNAQAQNPLFSKVGETAKVNVRRARWDGRHVYQVVRKRALWEMSI